MPPTCEEIELSMSFEPICLPPREPTSQEPFLTNFFIRGFLSVTTSLTLRIDSKPEHYHL